MPSMKLGVLLLGSMLVLAGSASWAGEQAGTIPCDPTVCNWSIEVDGVVQAEGTFSIAENGDVTLLGDPSVVGDGFTASIDSFSGNVDPEIVFGVGATNSTNSAAVFAFVFNVPLGGFNFGNAILTESTLGTTLTASSSSDARLLPVLGADKIVDSQDIRFNPFLNIDKGVDIGDPLVDAAGGVSTLRNEHEFGSIAAGNSFDLMNVTVAFSLEDGDQAVGNPGQVGVGLSGRVTQTDCADSGWSIQVNDVTEAEGCLRPEADGTVTLLGDPSVLGDGFAASINSCAITPDAELVFGLGATNSTSAAAVFAFAFNVPLAGFNNGNAITTEAALGTTLTASSSADATLFPTLGVGKIVDSADIQFSPFLNIDKGVDIGDPLVDPAGGFSTLRNELEFGSIAAGNSFDLMTVTVAFGLVDEDQALGNPGKVGVGLSGRVSQFVEGPTISLDPALSLNSPGGNHTVTATVLDAAGEAAPDVDVTFSVDSGPNAGAAGACTETSGPPSSSCTTDEVGMVNFTYDSDGSIGVDSITASFEGESGTVTSAPVLKFWDNDCNTNEIPDTCDLACGGFDGQCAEFAGCGGSSDDNGDGVPDECNAPPECEGALADPDELWPPNHKVKAILVEGVTDPDGDPVAVTVDSIFQDEQVYAPGNLGDLSPDGMGIGEGGGAAVRAERDPQQDGRVYHISFSAEDGSGGICTGTVTVCVPVNKRPGSTCVDGGPLYDSSDTAMVVRSTCGLGVELTLLLPPLLGLRSRRRRQVPR